MEMTNDIPKSNSSEVSITDEVFSEESSQTMSNEKKYSYIAEETTPSWKIQPSRWNIGAREKFYIAWLIFPCLISLWYAVAIFFPRHWYEKSSVFFWTPSARSHNSKGQLAICPRNSVCSEGTLQVFLLAVSRLTAYASYVIQGLVFVSKMHSFMHYLSSTHAALFVPFESLHSVHAFTGSAYFMMILLHSIAHFIRWSVRQELNSCASQVGWSGLIGLFMLLVTVFAMSRWAKTQSKYSFNMTYESRLRFHRFGSVLLVFVLCVHTKKSAIVSTIFFAIWVIDSLYGFFFRTHRLDLVEFSTLPNNTGTQMLWRNPNGFQTKSGEYVRVKVPWLSHGGKEWHPFSIYLREATKEGMDVINNTDHGEDNINVHKPEKAFQQINAKKTALILCEFQNEFAHPNGFLYSGVKAVIGSTQCIPKIQNLVQIARKSGIHIIHAPYALKRNHSSDNPNTGMETLNNYYGEQYFLEKTWNSKIIDELIPEPEDTVLHKGYDLDCFSDEYLEDVLLEKGIDTLILGGFLTNGSIESTMRTAHRKGFNTITLVDGTACNSKSEQLAAVNFNFKMFSTPITCSGLQDILQAEVAITEKMKRSQSIDTSNSFAMISSNNEMSIHSLKDFDLEGGEYIAVHMESEKTLGEFCTETLSCPYDDILDAAMVARKGLEKHETTQVFIFSSGDWTQGLAQEVGEQEKMRPCWVRGPYISPFFVASNFRYIILVATGVGITPALGVLGQYPGSSKHKVLVWICRSKNVIKFFTPLLKDSHITVIYYTGDDKLTPAELKHIYMHGNIFVHQSPSR